MARSGNWDVTLNKQGWFDVTAGDPLEGWFDSSAVGAEGIDINLSLPGIPSAESQALPKVFHIVSVPGVGVGSAETQAPAMVAQLIEPPGIPSAEAEAPATPAIVITAAAIPSAEEVAPAALATPPPPPTSTAAHGGWPATRAPRPTDQSQWSYAMPEGWTASDPWPSDEQFAARERPRFSFFDDAASNDNGDPNAPSLPPNVHVLDRFGPMQSLPEEEFLVAGAISENPWKWMLIGAAAAGLGVLAYQAMNKKAPKKVASKAPRHRAKAAR